MNKVVHFEIPFDNEERAKKFYQDTFGWQIFKVPEMDYSMVTTVETDQQTMIPDTGSDKWRIDEERSSNRDASSDSD